MIAILAGTPARQVEAACDLARTLVESDPTVGEITEPDGGVGDDAFEAVSLGGPEFSASADLNGDPTGWTMLSVGSPLVSWSLLARTAPDPALPRLGRLVDRSSCRQAWLQRFLF